MSRGQGARRINTGLQDYWGSGRNTGSQWSPIPHQEERYAKRERETGCAGARSRRVEKQILCHTSGGWLKQAIGGNG